MHSDRWAFGLSSLAFSDECYVIVKFRLRAARAGNPAGGFETTGYSAS